MGARFRACAIREIRIGLSHTCEHDFAVKEIVTQQMIAKRLGVSQSLVSRALRGSATDIHASPETIERIRQTAAQLGYHPSAAALTLRGESSRTIAVVVRDFADAFLGRLIGALQQVAAADGYSLFLSGVGSESSPADWRMLFKYGMDGLIVVGGQFEPEVIPAFARQRLPVVQIGVGRARIGVQHIAMDVEAGIGMLMDHAGKAGHRAVGFLGDGSATSRYRRSAIEAELRRRKWPPMAFVFDETPGPDAGYSGARALCARGRRGAPTVLLATDDAAAQTSLRGFYECGWRVPADISVLGIDDLPSSARCIPALTTLRQPIAELAREAFVRVRAATPELPTEVRIPPELIIRESCAAPRSET